MLPCRLYRIYIRVLMQIHATYDILPHTSNARSLSPPRWVDRRYILYTYTHTTLHEKFSRILSQSWRERHALSGGRRTSWWRRQRGNVGPCARFSRNGHATMRGKVCNVSDRFCPRSSSIWSLALLRHSKERKRERRRRRKKERKKDPSTTPRCPPLSRIELVRDPGTEDREFIGILAGPVVVMPRKN